MKKEVRADKISENCNASRTIFATLVQTVTLHYL